MTETKNQTKATDILGNTPEDRVVAQIKTIFPILYRNNFTNLNSKEMK